MSTRKSGIKLPYGGGKSMHDDEVPAVSPTKTSFKVNQAVRVKASFSIPGRTREVGGVTATQTMNVPAGAVGRIAEVLTTGYKLRFPTTTGDALKPTEIFPAVLLEPYTSFHLVPGEYTAGPDGKPIDNDYA